jgi:hypothetical protein
MPATTFTLAGDTMQLYVSSCNRKDETAYIALEGMTVFENGHVTINHGKVKAAFSFYEKAVWELEDFLNKLVDEKRVQRFNDHLATFNAVKELYPAIAIGGLKFSLNDCRYNSEHKGVYIDPQASVCTLFHELGHAFADVYYQTHTSDEALAWDTAKSLAIEVGYQWTVEDDQRMAGSLASYGIKL